MLVEVDERSKCRRCERSKWRSQRNKENRGNWAGAFGAAKGFNGSEDDVTEEGPTYLQLFTQNATKLISLKVNTALTSEGSHFDGKQANPNTV